MPTTAAATKAIGIVRVSQLGDRDRDRFSSPKDQCDKMRALAQDHGWNLTIPEPYEIDVSGDSALEDRPVLSRAVMSVQTGTHDVLVAADVSRLWWNQEVRAQVLRLVEGAGGEVWTREEGRISNEDPTDEFNGTITTASARRERRVNGNKSRDAVARAISEGRVPWHSTTPGYDVEDGRLVPNAEAPVVAAAFAMRADGATVKDVRAFLADHGIDYSYNGMHSLLASRVVLGEIHFGKYEPNLAAHPPIVDRELWKRVQRVKVPRGRYPASVRLLARTGVLRCGNCDHAMVAGARVQSGKRYPYYRCCYVDCPARVVIAAELVEDLVVAELKRLMEDIRGTATGEDSVAEAACSLERAQAAYDAGMAVLDPLEPAAVTRLGELRAARDEARERHEAAVANSAATSVAVTAGDWDRLTLEERRGLIRAVIESVVVAPGGRGAERVTITPA
jgi:site-specific DNA recombinase